MKCPFELPVKKKPDFANEDLFRIESATGLFLSFSLKEDEVDYIVHAINSHEKLLGQIEKDGFLANHAINTTPTGNLRNKLTEMNIERLQTLKEAEKPQ